MTILRSILITSIVSVLFGFALRNLFGFWEAATLAFVLQFIIAFTVSSFKLNKVSSLTMEFETELQQLLDLNEATITCPCNNNTFTENIFINMDNSYTCEKCNNTYRIDVNLVPTLLTETMDVNKSLVDITKEIKDVEVTSEYEQGTEL
jgi:hypothetical protein|tara:strand:- start:1926 stop:2372 length:447 start_codon:yes stop_codon:yes gene_type:complete